VDIKVVDSLACDLADTNKLVLQGLKR